MTENKKYALATLRKVRRMIKEVEQAITHIYECCEVHDPDDVI